jgi:hypothetical protein
MIRIGFVIFVAGLVVYHAAHAFHPGAGQTPDRQGVINVSYTPGHPANTFSPFHALGAGVDGHEKGVIRRMYTPGNRRAMLSAGFKPLTYRLRTELGAEAWHWNPKGAWSDPARKQGYWTSDDKAAGPISVCYGYRLPRRGSTNDQANNDGYSRMDDGDPRSFWKSNPYLDRHFTGEDNALRPQWVLIDLGKEESIDAIRIAWGRPFATEYSVEYGVGPYAGPDAAYLRGPRAVMWRAFPLGAARRGDGDNAQVRLSDAPISARFVRIFMTGSSGGEKIKSRDIRDNLGYAIRELYLGALDESGKLVDLIRHAADHDRQTVIYASSTDPWHRAVDKDEQTEQPGLDLVFKSGLTNGLPMLTAVPLLYDTPENAAAEMRYLRSRGHLVERVEMGEEPEGQYVSPEDYAALYLQWAGAIHKVTPGVQLGGPCFAAVDAVPSNAPGEPRTRDWMEGFLNYLRARERLSDFNFFSFEWYPFDEACEPTAPQLAEAPEMLGRAMEEMRQAGVPDQIPWLITEYGYSAFAAQAEVDIEGALLNADIVGQFLTLGGDETYLYGYEPNELIQELPCAWGNNMLFLRDESWKARYELATYHGARLLTREWAQPTDSPHEVYPAASDIRDPSGRALVTAYAVRRPDKQWALMLINKDPTQSFTTRVQFRDSITQEPTPLRGPADLYQFSPKQYAWHANGARGYPLRSQPPAHTVLAGRGEVSVVLPANSISIVRGNGPGQ